MTATTLRAKETFASAAELDLIRYSQVWEDPAVLRRALAIGPDDDVLSIAGAGCNVLALLLAEPRSVVALDVSPAQVALTELKLAALPRLSHAEFAGLVGAAEHGVRAELYGRVRAGLSPRTRAFWDSHRGVLDGGLLGAGMLDRYFAAFRKRHIARLVDPAAIECLLTLDDPDRQAELFARHFTSPELVAAVREHFTPAAMSGRARDATQFRYVEGNDVGTYFLDRLRHVCTELPTRGNFHLEWLLTGRYRDLTAGPPYLRAENYSRLRELADRVTVVEGELGAFLETQRAESFSAVNVSDVFEYLPEDASADLLGLLGSRLRPGGRLAYWNLLVPRSLPGGRADGLSARRAESRELWRRDRVFFYRDFHIDEKDCC
jgi:S-adenosylmethionine-diacylglycerol 3-amino-3-carboxypropyl transferase